MPKRTKDLPFDSLLNQFETGLWRQTIGPNAKILFVNDALCRFLGYTRQELFKMPPNRLFDKQRTYASLMRRAVSGKIALRKEVVLTGKVRSGLDMVMSVIPVLNDRGRVECVDIIAENVFLQRNVQADLADSKELFKTVFNHSAVAILVTDAQKRIVAWNPFAEHMLGLGREELFNRSVEDLYPKKEWEKITSLSARRKGSVSDIETQIIKKGKKILDVNLSLSAIRNREGKTIGTIGIMHDVSVQKKTQRMLLDAKRAAESASEAKTMFLANMSHEVRTPMNTILGMIDLTLDMDLTMEQRDNLLTVKNAADILLSLLNDILDLSRVEAGKIQLESIEINIERTVRSICKTMDILAKNKGLSLQWLIDENVPDMVKGDPVRIRQILVNLINNAIKFTQKGNIRVEVRVKSSDEDSCVLHFVVADQGIGIEKNKQEKIFDAFTQADASTTRQFGGTGLGLTICRRLLELMGGRIWVESAAGEGSKFHFLIPAAIVHKEDVPEALQEESIESQLMAQITRKKDPELRIKKEHLRILLAEDNPVNQKMTEKILEKKGWSVVAANNGKEVVDILAGQEQFDLILMDAQMPVMDGLEATREIRKLEQGRTTHIPIIALTARAMTGDRKKCLESGMDGYVSKPIDRTQLYEVIESFFII